MGALIPLVEYVKIDEPMIEHARLDQPKSSEEKEYSKINGILYPHEFFSTCEAMNAGEVRDLFIKKDHENKIRVEWWK